MKYNPSLKIKIEFMALEKDLEVSPFDTVDTLKSTIEQVYDIPQEQQSLILDDRNITMGSKTLDELGIKDGSTVLVKKMHRISGKMKSGGINSIMKNPMVKNMLKNPSTMKSIQEMFPGLKDEMEENSSLNMLMNTEGMEDELEKFAADDNYMNTQMRNADITLAKLQNLPDGVRLMSSLAKDSQSMGFLQPSVELKGGHALQERNDRAIPGKNSKNHLIEYRKQLSLLRQIGFGNARENIEVLKSVEGDLESAQKILIRRYEKR